MRDFNMTITTLNGSTVLIDNRDHDLRYNAITAQNLQDFIADADSGRYRFGHVMNDDKKLISWKAA